MMILHAVACLDSGKAKPRGNSRLRFEDELARFYRVCLCSVATEDVQPQALPQLADGRCSQRNRGPVMNSIQPRPRENHRSVHGSTLRARCLTSNAVSSSLYEAVAQGMSVLGGPPSTSRHMHAVV